MATRVVTGAYTDATETDVADLRRTIYLTIMSSVRDFEEAETQADEDPAGTGPGEAVRPAGLPAPGPTHTR